MVQSGAIEYHEVGGGKTKALAQVFKDSKASVFFSPGHVEHLENKPACFKREDSCVCSDRHCAWNWCLWLLKGILV